MNNCGKARLSATSESVFKILMNLFLTVESAKGDRGEKGGPIEREDGEITFVIRFSLATTAPLSKRRRKLFCPCLSLFTQ